MQAALNNTTVQTSPSCQKGNSKLYILTLAAFNNVLLKWSFNLTNYHQIEQFQVGCAIKTRVWITAADSICCLGFFGVLQGISSPHTSFFFFPLSSFNSKMAWQQLRSHIRNELRHWQEQRQLSCTFSLLHFQVNKSNWDTWNEVLSVNYFFSFFSFKCVGV